MNSQDKKIIRIAITGPESTGKSTLAKELASHYNSIWIPEYAREYIDKLSRPYQKDDLYLIAKGQMELQKKSIRNANRYLFCDSDPLVLKIWSEYRYGDTHPFIISEFEKNQYDLYLLMDIDLPWEYDPQREHQRKQRFFFNWFERELIDKKADFNIVSGTHEIRLQNAIQFIEKLNSQ